MDGITSRAYYHSQPCHCLSQPMIMLLVLTLAGWLAGPFERTAEEVRGIIKGD
jgi:hypothetical protein